MADWYELDDLDRDELIGEIEHLRNRVDEDTRNYRKFLDDYQNCVRSYTDLYKENARLRAEVNILLKREYYE